MPNGQPAQLANLKSFRPGHVPKPATRSRRTDRALKLFRNMTPDAAAYAARVLADENEHTSYRLKAMECILTYGMPKNLDELLAKAWGEGGARAFMTVEFVRPGERSEHGAFGDGSVPVDVEVKPNGHGTFAVSFGDK
jgi:hypothetical protein